MKSQSRKLEIDFWRAVAEASMDAIVIIDDDETIVHVNSAGERLFGYSSSQLLGKRSDILVAPENREDYLRALAQYREQGESWLVGKRTYMTGMTASKALFIAEISYNHVQCGNGPIFSAFIRDVTGETRRREQLAQSELTYRLAARASFDSVWDWNLETNSSWRNDGVYRLFGYAPKDVRPDVGWWENRIHPDDRDRVTRDLRKAIDKPDTEHWSDTYRFLHRDGSYREVLDRGYILRGRDGHGCRMVGAMFDVTYLREKERKLVEAIQARDQFVAVVSHELKNPLTAIGTGIELLQRLEKMHAPRERLREVVERMPPSVHRMRRLVQDLLDVSRIESRKLQIRRRREDFQAIVAECVVAATPQAQSKGIQIELQTDPGPLPTECDRDRLVQVISNLLDNAIKFSNAGSRVVVRDSYEPATREVHFEVEDHGPGLNPEELSKVFERFWQSKRTAFQGTGLGLFIAKGIIEAHGGRISAACSPNSGCVFSFNIPTGLEAMQAA